MALDARTIKLTGPNVLEEHTVRVLPTRESSSWQMKNSLRTLSESDVSGALRRSSRIEWVAALFLASGGGLLVYIVSGISLRWTCLALGLAAVATGAVAVRRMALPRRARFTRRVAVGAMAGFVATVAYDVVRITLVELADMQLRPFEAWRLFGLALTGSDQSSTVVFLAGTAFHLCNGIAFGIAYTVAFGTRGPIAGIVWALVLETFMVSVYPGWLGLAALDEFLQVTIAGHLVYGGVLGWLARSLLCGKRWGEHDASDQPPSDAATDPAAL